MIVAMLILSRTQELVSVGEGKDKYSAKADAIYNCPKENESVRMADCEWVIDSPDELAQELPQV